MGSRILTLQRQARELGRLRSGFIDSSGNRPRPVRSQTWIVSSHAKHYVEAAAALWGGSVEQWQPLGNGAAQWRVITHAEAVDAILPPGDPLSQSYESWSRGGVQRRCDGMTETLSDRPCLCRGQWGDTFWEKAPRDQGCKMTTRLNVLLADMPDIGVWRVETHSFYAAGEMAAAVDTLKGGLGADAMIPVRLRIEPRTRVAQGKTKQFPVITVELRGATAGQVLSGQAPAVERKATAAAIGPGGGTGITADQRKRIARLMQERGITDAAQAKAFVSDVVARDVEATATLTADEASVVIAQLEEVGTEGGGSHQQAESPPVMDAEVVEPDAAPETPDVDELWMRIVNLWPGTKSELDAAFERGTGVLPGDADEAVLDRFLTELKAGRHQGKAAT